jgi:hypothetical protein
MVFPQGIFKSIARKFSADSDIVSESSPQGCLPQLKTWPGRSVGRHRALYRSQLSHSGELQKVLYDNMDSNKTESEILFARLCDNLRIPFVPINRSDSKTPDYEVTLGGHKVVTEVKQLDPNDDDERFLADFRSQSAGCSWSKPGRRVRLKIQDCKKQLKARSQGTFPAMLVIYDNGTAAGTDGTDVKTAMYGDEKVTITPFRDGATDVSAIHPGGGRKCTDTYNTTISAVALLYGSSNYAQLSVFHNHFAAIPIDPAWFHDESFRHYTLDPTDHDADYEWRPL